MKIKTQKEYNDALAYLKYLFLKPEYDGYKFLDWREKADAVKKAIREYEKENANEL